MNAFCQRRVWFSVAVVAILFTFIALLVPHTGNSPNQSAWQAILPVVFVGLIATFSLLPLLVALSVAHLPAAPALASSFQRPPPFRIA